MKINPTDQKHYENLTGIKLDAPTPPAVSEDVMVPEAETKTIGAGRLNIEGGSVATVWHGDGGEATENLFGDRQASSNKGRRYGPFEDQGDGSLKLVLPEEGRPRRMRWEMYI